MGILAPDKLHVILFVGNYKIITHKGIEYIISEEYIPSVPGEQTLRAHTHYLDINNKDSLLQEFVNLEVNDNNELISYCNRYGLPAYSTEYWSRRATRYLLEDPDKDSPIYLRDYIPLNVFKKFHNNIANLVALVSDPHFVDDPNKAVQSLLSIFVSYYSNDTCGFVYGINPVTKTGRYIFQLCYGINDFSPSKLSELIAKFVYVRPNILQDPMGDNRLYELYDNILKTFVIDNEKTFPQTDACGNLLITKKTKVSYNMIEMCKRAANIVIRELLNERFYTLRPVVEYEDGEYKSSWNIPSQLDGVMFELFLKVSRNCIIKKCANPGCNNYFVVTRKNKKSCDSNCRCSKNQREYYKKLKETKSTSKQ